MKSYIKIYGPPLLKAVHALEGVAVRMPEVCIMDTVIARGVPGSLARDIGGEPVGDYFGSQGISITRERCDNIISRSGESLGEYVFYFEWFTPPTVDQLNDLIRKIDKALLGLGCRYTITTR